MSLTVAKRNDGLWQLGLGPGVMQRVTLSPGLSDYPTGGYALSGSPVGLSTTGGPANNGLHGVLFEGGNTASLGYVPFYNEQTGTLQILTTGSAAGNPLQELANASNLSGAVFYAIYEGAGE